MNIISAIFLVCFCFLQGYTQNNAYLKKQFKAHYESIRMHGFDERFPANEHKIVPEYFIDFVVDKVSKENPALKYHITNRYLFQRVSRVWICTDSLAVLQFNGKKEFPREYCVFFTPKKGEKIELESIDISYRSYKLNTSIRIPDSAYKEVYYPNFCYACFPVRPVEAFISKNEKYMYIYVYGVKKEKLLLDCNEYGEVEPLEYIVKYVVALKPALKYLGRIFIPFKDLRHYHLSTDVEMGF